MEMEVRGGSVATAGAGVTPPCESVILGVSVTVAVARGDISFLLGLFGNITSYE